MPGRCIAIALALTASCGGSSAFSWTAKAALPVPRADHALVGAAGKLFAIGGFSGSTLARVDAYDPAANSWNPVAPMAAARREFAAGVIDGKIYVACGMSWSDANSVTYVKTAERYDPAADAWSGIAPCPIDLGFVNSVYSNVHIAGAAVGGKLYVVSYRAGSGPSATLWAYDPATDKWSQKIAPPFTYATYAAAELKGQLYLVATALSPGANPKGADFAQYDPASDVWIIRPSLSGVAWPALASAGGRLYALGGMRAPALAGPLTSVNEFDPASGAWSAAGQTGVARHSAAAASVDGSSLWFAGGSTSVNQFADVPLSAVEMGTPFRR